MSHSLSLTKHNPESSFRETFWDILGHGSFAFLFYTASLGLFFTTFSIPLPLAPFLLMGAGFIFLVGFLYRKSARRPWVMIGSLVLPLLVFFLLQNQCLTGLNLTVNQVLSTLGQWSGHIVPQYPLYVETTAQGSSQFLFLSLVSFLLSLLALYLSASPNKLLPLLFLLAGFLFQLCTELYGSPIFVFLFYSSLGLLLLKKGWQRNSLKASGKGLVALFLCLGALGGGLFFILSPLRSSVNLPLGWLKSSATDQISRWRYERTPVSSLPEGNLPAAGPLEFTEHTALEVTMDSPDSLYLRGFVGERYENSQWEALTGTDVFSAHDLFYWLHEDDFYGQTQLSHIAGLLEDESPTPMTIYNKNASSQYIYAPYEVNAASKATQPFSLIGDAAFVSDGFSGNRVYEFQVLSNQVKRYPELVEKLYQEEMAGNTTIHPYLIDESHYNLYVYDRYLELPPHIRELAEKHLGTYDAKGEEHLSYQEAKQNILGYFSDHITYEETPASLPSQSDFLTHFLENSAEGYSIHYATAATVFFRYYGIPARYVEGFIITPKDADSARSGIPFSVPGTRSHAWTEIYQDGIGWVPFETTPPYLQIMEQADVLQGTADGASGTKEKDVADVTQPEENLSKKEPASTLNRLWQVLKNLGQWLLRLLILLFGLSLLLLTVWVIRRRSQLAQRKKNFRTKKYNEDVLYLYTYYQELLKICPNDAWEPVATPIKKIYETAAFSLHQISKSERDLVYDQVNLLANNVKKTTPFLKSLYYRGLKGLY